MTTSYFTFMIKQVAYSGGYVRVDSDGSLPCRSGMLALCGTTWAFEYDQEPWSGYNYKGCLVHIKIINGGIIATSRQDAGDKLVEDFSYNNGLNVCFLKSDQFDSITINEE